MPPAGRLSPHTDRSFLGCVAALRRPPACKAAGRRQRWALLRVEAADLSCSCALQTAGFLEAVATAALKTRLRQHSLVRTSIDCDTFSLLAGRVNSVAIAGRDWISPLGLSARILEVSLGEAALDVPGILQKQRIYLLGVPCGVGRIVFTAAQFDLFLQHPLMLAAAATAVQGRRFAFEGGSVRYELGSQAISFSGTWAADGRRYQVSMQPAGGGAVLVSPTADPQGPDAGAVAAALTAFFSRLTLDLQGPELAFAGMALVPGESLASRPGILPSRLQATLPYDGAGAGEPLLDLRLSVRVLAFPPSNPSF